MVLICCRGFAIVAGNFDNITCQLTKQNEKLKNPSFAIALQNLLSDSAAILHHHPRTFSCLATAAKLHANCDLRLRPEIQALPHSKRGKSSHCKRVFVRALLTGHPLDTIGLRLIVSPLEIGTDYPSRPAVHRGAAAWKEQRSHRPKIATGRWTGVG